MVAKDWFSCKLYIPCKHKERNCQKKQKYSCDHRGYDDGKANSFFFLLFVISFPNTYYFLIAFSVSQGQTNPANIRSWFCRWLSIRSQVDFSVLLVISGVISDPFITTFSLNMSRPRGFRRRARARIQVRILSGIKLPFIINFRLYIVRGDRK